MVKFWTKDRKWTKSGIPPRETSTKKFLLDPCLLSTLEPIPVKRCTLILTHVDLSVKPKEISVAGREDGDGNRDRQKSGREGNPHLVESSLGLNAKMSR